MTLNNRVVGRLGPDYWATFDFKKSINLQNTVRQLDKDLDPPEGDASERYGFLPNGLFAFWLQNGKGERQDTAPDFIAPDKRTPNVTSDNDGRVHIGLSCIACHVAPGSSLSRTTRENYTGGHPARTPPTTRSPSAIGNSTCPTLVRSDPRTTRHGTPGRLLKVNGMRELATTLQATLTRRRYAYAEEMR